MSINTLAEIALVVWVLGLVMGLVVIALALGNAAKRGNQQARCARREERRTRRRERGARCS